MARYIWHDGEWRVAIRRPRVSVAPAIHRDGMSVGFHPGSEKPTDSKSEWRRWNREFGFTEMGTDAPTEQSRSYTPAVTKADIAEAISMLKQGYKPDPLPSIHEGDFADVEVREYAE